MCVDFLPYPAGSKLSFVYCQMAPHFTDRVIYLVVQYILYPIHHNLNVLTTNMIPFIFVKKIQGMNESVSVSPSKVSTW